ncbi:S49 family peptidase, partial [Patescibacteria group bacterium]|nr:S49 family peptidase [Patescibacteria group bacterium]
MRIKTIIKSLAILLIVTASIIVIKDEVFYQFGYYDDEAYYEENSLDTCNVLNIKLHGDLYTYTTGENLDEVASQDIISAIENADSDPNIKAIILEIDSVGGTPVAAEEVASALKRAQKPTVALIREYGTSAAYLAATGADMIFASAMSDVGSIGITMSYLDYSKQNQQEGITYNQLISGKFKDIGNPDKPLAAEEKELFMRDVKILNDNFIKIVAENRNLDVEEVRKLADGSSVLGEMALEKGLID